MDIARLRTFLAVVDAGSISRAADRLHIVQPALSRQIRLLEEELGTVLFLRHARGMTLTDSGEALVERARPVLTEFDHIKANMATLPGEVTGTVVLGLLPSISDLLAAGIARRLMHAHPRVSLRIVSAFASHLFEALDKRETDLAIMYEPRTPNSYEIWPLLREEPLYLVGPASAKLDLKRAVPLRKLTEHPLILPSARHNQRILIDAVAAKARLTLNVVIEADSIQVQKQLVRSALGFTVLPVASIYDDLRLKQVSAAPIACRDLKRRICLVLPLVRKRALPVRHTAELLVEEVRSRIEAGDWPGARLARTQ